MSNIFVGNLNLPEPQRLTLVPYLSFTEKSRVFPW